MPHWTPALGTASQVHCVFVFDREIRRTRCRRVATGVRGVHPRRTRRGGCGAGRGGRRISSRCTTAAPETRSRHWRRVWAWPGYAARDYEPLAIERDREEIAERLRADGRALVLHKDEVVFDRDEGRRPGPASRSRCSCPTRNAWMKRLTPEDQPSPLADRGAVHGS
jgi:hypothetical protein